MTTFGEYKVKTENVFVRLFKEQLGGEHNARIRFTEEAKIREEPYSDENGEKWRTRFSQKSRSFELMNSIGLGVSKKTGKKTKEACFCEESVDRPNSVEHWVERYSSMRKTLNVQPSEKVIDFETRKKAAEAKTKRISDQAQNIRVLWALLMSDKVLGQVEAKMRELWHLQTDLARDGRLVGPVGKLGLELKVDKAHEQAMRLLRKVQGLVNKRGERLRLGREEI